MRSLVWVMLVAAPVAAQPKLLDKKLEVLERLIAATSDDDPEKPDLIFRQAEEYLQRAREPVDAAERDRWRKQGVARLTFVANEPKFAGYRRLDEVMFYLAFELSQMRQAAAARDYYKRLIDKYPDSKFVSDAHLVFGEEAFERGDLVTATAFYRKASERPSRVRDYAQYKIAWCEYNQSHFDAALAGFLALGRGAEQPKLAVEARKDAVRVCAHICDPDKARALFSGLPDAERMLDMLAEAYRALGKRDECRRLARGVVCD
jgi:tetratricopeptide (TPR) repeat protein